MKKNSFIKSLNAMKSKLSKNKRLEESKNAAYLHLNVAPTKTKKSSEDIAARILAGIIMGFLAAGFWFALTIGIFVSPDSSLWLKVPMVMLFVVGTCIIEFFLIRWIATSPGEWKLDRNNNSGNAAHQYFLKNKSSSFYDNTSYCGLRGNKYNMHRR